MAASRGLKCALCGSMVAIFLFYCLLLLHTPTVVVDPTNGRKLVVILLDGFGREQLRHLLATSDDNAFKAMASKGVSAEFMRPIFPTLTQPNHYALMTGLYAEDHGVVHDTIYDARTKEEFRFDKKPSGWLAAEPVWLAVERNGKPVHLSTTQCHKSVPVLNITASCKNRTSTNLQTQLKSLHDNLNEAFSRVAIGDTVLAVVHTPLIHKVIHEHGPSSIESEEAIEQVDEILSSFLHGVLSLRSKINVMVVSEVGLAPTANKKPLLIDSALNSTNVAKMIGGGGYFALWPVAGKEKEVMETLHHHQGVRVQTKVDGHMLEKFHYRKHELIAPIHIVADDGYVLQTGQNEDNAVKAHAVQGLHGYDPYHVDYMKAIFYAQGPQFATGSRLDYISSPNVYNIVRNVLKMDHHPRPVKEGVLASDGGHHH